MKHHPHNNKINPYAARAAPGDKHLGYFPTARDAAVALAKHAKGEVVVEEDDDTADVDDDFADNGIARSGFQ